MDKNEILNKSREENANADLYGDEVLKTVVPTEAGETHRIFLMDLVQGINSGYAIDYVKTGKQMNGTPLNPEDLAGYKEFYELYKDRLLNVRFNLASYIPKMRDNKALVELRSKAYAILNSMPVANVAPQVQATVLDPDKELRETLTQLMTDALKNKDMALYKELKAERDALKAPEVVGAVAPQTTQSSAPSFDLTEGSIDDLDFTANTTELATDKDETSGPIEFDLDSSKPTWDATQA